MKVHTSLQAKQGSSFFSFFFFFLLDFHGSYFLPCRAAISCSSSCPFRASQAIRTISTSHWNLCITMPSSAAPHVKSRCAQYPGSKLKRFPVPDDKVDWSHDWRQYNPVNHTDPSLTKKPVWADPDIGWATHTWFKLYLVKDCTVCSSVDWSIYKYKIVILILMFAFKDHLEFIHAGSDDLCLLCSSFSPKFNTVDGSVDRTSFEGTYKIEKGKPL